MKKRTVTNSVMFRRPFLLPGHREPFPAGNYTIETEEVLIDDQAHARYRRLVTLMCYEPEGGARSFTQFLNIDPGAVEAALARDRASVRPALYLVGAGDTAEPEQASASVDEPGTRAANWEGPTT